MPGKNAHSITFSDDHDRVIDEFMKEARASRSQAVRILLDEAIWASQNVGSQYLEMKKELLRSEIRQIDEQIEAQDKAKAEIQNSSELQVVRTVAVTGGRVTIPKGFVDKRIGKSEEALFLITAAHIARDGKVLSSELRAKFLAQAENHPEWVAKIQEPFRTETMRLMNLAKHMKGGRT